MEGFGKDELVAHPAGLGVGFYQSDDIPEVLLHEGEIEELALLSPKSVQACAGLGGSPVALPLVLAILALVADPLRLAMVTRMHFLRIAQDILHR